MKNALFDQAPIFSINKVLIKENLREDMNGREKMFYLSDAVNRINFKEKIPAKVRTNIKNGEEKIFKVVTKVNSMVNI